MTPAIKRQILVNWLREHGSAEASFARALRGFFFGQRDKILQAAKSFSDLSPAIASQLVDESAAYDDLIAASYPAIANMVATAATRMVGEPATDFRQGEKAFSPGEFLVDFSMPQALQATVEAAITELGTQPWWDAIARSVGAEVGEILTAAVAEGLSERRKIARLRRELTSMGRRRAQQIARSETTAALNAGHLAGLLEAGEEIDQKQWLAIIDGDTRESHVAADGQSVAVSGVFTVGSGSARFPGDPELPAKERIGCRCVVVGEISA